MKILFIILLLLSSCQQLGIDNTLNNPTETIETQQKTTYILNKNSMKIHLNNCFSVENMLEENKIYSNELYSDLVIKGYVNCLICCPS